jgi:hypothetical protein
MFAFKSQSYHKTFHVQILKLKPKSEMFVLEVFLINYTKLREKALPQKIVEIIKITQLCVDINKITQVLCFHNKTEENCDFPLQDPMSSFVQEILS